MSIDIWLGYAKRSCLFFVHSVDGSRAFYRLLFCCEQEADLLAAPVTYSDIRARVINFTEHFMTFETVVLMKRTGSAERINSPVELSQHDDIQYGLVKDGFTENFFRRSGNQFYRDMYERMDKAQLPLTSADGVHKVQDSDGRYAFMIDSSTAEY